MGNNKANNMFSQKPNVFVLMSTYNGENFIREQIDSILNQQDVNVHLFVRDDGSQDQTCEILKEYTQAFQNITVFFGKNIGIGNSFLQLLEKVPRADYYAFSDQDDVWLNDKLKEAISIIRKAETSSYCHKWQGKGKTICVADIDEDGRTISKTMPVLYGSNQTLVDKDLNVLGDRLEDNQLLHFYDNLSRNSVYGCTMVMNHLLREICIQKPRPDDLVLKARNHDAWILYSAYISGVFVFDVKSHMLYRQHENNVVGGIKQTGIKYIEEKWRRLISKKNRGLRSRTAQSLLEAYCNVIDDDIRCKLEILSHSHTISGAFRLCRDSVLIKSIGEYRLIVFLRGVLGWI